MIEELERRRRSAFADGPRVQDTDGWVRIPYDAGKFVEHYAPLRLKPGYELWVYQHGFSGNSSTRLFAVPQGCSWELRFPVEDPRPPEALGHFMEAVEGDGS